MYTVKRYLFIALFFLLSLTKVVGMYQDAKIDVSQCRNNSESIPVCKDMVSVLKASINMVRTNKKTVTFTLGDDHVVLNPKDSMITFFEGNRWYSLSFDAYSVLAAKDQEEYENTLRRSDNCY